MIIHPFIPAKKGNTMINNEIREVKRIRHLLNPESTSGVKFGVDITYNNEPTPEESEKKAVDIFNRIKPEYRMICFTADNYRVGEKNEYLSSIVSSNDIAKLNSGESALFLAPTGTGKTRVVQSIIKSFSNKYKVFFLTNRIACVIQFLKDLLESEGIKDIPPEIIERVKVTENLEVMTYQEFALKTGKYKGREMLIILDEVHSLAEDSVFSDYGQKIVSFLRCNLDNTIRFYMTATADEILETIKDIEKLKGCDILPETINEETPVRVIYDIDHHKFSRIKQVYLMYTDWNYIDFKFYNPNDTQKLIDFIKTANDDGIKGLIYCNDIQKGMKLKEMLGDTQQVYSDEDKKAELAKIAIQEHFDSSNLITTKVAENGLSLHDQNLGFIVAETWDLTVLQQIIGRARVDRKHPRKITVLVPDYSASDIGNFIGKVYPQLSKALAVAENPDSALEHFLENTPYVYYSAFSKKAELNEMAIITLKRQYKFLTELRAEENKEQNAYARKVLELYGFEPVVTDEMFLNYDNIRCCKECIHNAWSEYMKSDCGEEAVKILKADLKSACNETGAYSKTLDSNIQVSTVNEILRFAGVEYQLEPKRCIYGFNNV